MLLSVNSFLNLLTAGFQDSSHIFCFLFLQDGDSAEQVQDRLLWHHCTGRHQHQAQEGAVSYVWWKQLWCRSGFLKCILWKQERRSILRNDVRTVLGTERPTALHGFQPPSTLVQFPFKTKLTHMENLNCVVTTWHCCKHTSHSYPCSLGTSSTGWNVCYSSWMLNSWYQTPKPFHSSKYSKSGLVYFVVRSLQSYLPSMNLWGREDRVRAFCSWNSCVLDQLCYK